MENSKRLIFIAFFVIPVLFLISGCGAQKSDSAMPHAEKPYEIVDEFDVDAEYNEEMGESSNQKPEYIGDKVITTYYINLETLNFKDTNIKINELIKKHKAYIENSNISDSGFEYSKNYKYGSYSIRIPKENIDIFRSELKNFGNITDESSTKEDVSKFYRDTESRLNLVTSKEKRLLILLEEAEKIEDIIAIESELTDTIYEKEILKADLTSIDDKIQYSTLNLDLVEVRNYSNVDKADSSLGIRLKNAFKDSFFAFKIAIENFIIWFVFAIPYIVIIVPIAILGFVFIKRRKNKNGKIK